MKLQFYLGRAGAGKSWRCLDEIAARLREDPSPRRHPLVLLLPEQATAQAEAQLLRCPGVRGFTRARILSFKRLARLVLEETGGASGDWLDDAARHLLLRALLARHRDHLLAFGRSAREAGFIKRLAATFTELAQFRHSFDDLEAQRARLEQEGRGESSLARKLHDLILLGRAWEAELGSRFANPDHFLDETARRIAQSRLFRGAEVWMDGFASFMPQERRIIEMILETAAMVRVALLLDPADLDALPISARDADTGRLFNQTEETLLQLRGLAVDRGIEEAPPVLLPAPRQPTRFSRERSLAAFEKNLLRSSLIPRGKPATAFKIMSGFPEQSFPPIVFVEAAGRREEIEGVARAIRRFCREEGLRYRDIAIIARNLDAYEALIRSTFARYHIPYFLDRRRSVTHHPLVELLRSSVRAVTTDWAFEHVVHYLKTDFAPIERFEADQIENEALARGMRGRRWWLEMEQKEKKPSGKAKKKTETPSSAEEPGQASRELRRQALAPLDALHRRLMTEQNEERALPADRFAQVLQEFLDELRCGEQVAAWAAAARDAGNLDLAEEHEQTADGVARFLEEIRQALGNEFFPLDDLAEVLETGLQGLTLGLVPPSLDQVLIGTIERSRQPDLQVSFLIGLNDRVFPAVAGEDAVFSDSERRDLLESGGFQIAPPSSVKLFRERYLGYIAFTRSSKRIWISWPTTEDDGKEMRPSPFVRAAMESAESSASAVCIRLGPNWLDQAVEAVELPEHVVEGLLRRRAAAMSGESFTAWNALASRLETFPVEPRLQKVLSADFSEKPAALDESAMRDAPSTIAVSASRLETYALCPFRYFSQYMLLLQEREAFQIRPLEIGSFHHAILEAIFQILSAKYGTDSREILPGGIGSRVLDWGTVPMKALHAALEQAAEMCRDEFLADGPIQARQADFFVRRSCRQIEALLRSFILQGAQDNFVQAGAELGFGYEHSSLPALDILRAHERSVYLRGKIDRLDFAIAGKNIFVRILDFKSSEKTLELSKILGGIMLQLPLYLAALLKAGKGHLQPAGVFFVPVRRKMENTSIPPEENETEPVPENITVRMRGVVDDAALDLFGPLEPGESSPWIHVKLKKDGSVWDPKRSDWVEAGVLEQICDRACREAARLSEGILSCLIRVHPVRIGEEKACTHCGFSDICRVDSHTAQYRILPSLPRSEAVKQMQMDTL